MRSGNAKRLESAKPSHDQNKTIPKLSSISSRSKHNIGLFEKEKNSLSRIRNPSFYSMLRAPYTKDDIQRVSKCVTEERIVLMNEEIISNSKNLMKTDKDRNPKRQMKKSVLTLPPSTLPPSPGCRHCHEALELCEKCANFKSKTCATKRVRTAIGDKLQTDSEKEQESGVDDEKIKKTSTLRVSDITPSIPFMLSNTLIPDKKELNCHDMWNIIKVLNQRHCAKEKYEKSEESVLDPFKVRRHKKRNDARVSESTTTEEFTYSFECRNKIESSGFSNGSSNGTDSAMYRPFEAFCFKKDSNWVQNGNKHDHRLSIQNPRSDATDTTGAFGDLTNSYDDSSGRMKELVHRKDFLKYNKETVQAKNVQKTTSNRLSKGLARNEDNLFTKYSSHTKSSSPPVQTNKKNRNRKMTFVDIKRKLAQIKYPLTIMGKEACASVIVPEYIAPQFAHMPKIWQYMSGWSTDYIRDNRKPDKFLRLLQKQDKLNRTYRGVFGRQPKQSSRSTVRDNNLQNKTNDSLSNSGITDKTLRVLFRNVCEAESKTAQLNMKQCPTQPPKTQTVNQTLTVNQAQPKKLGISPHKVEVVTSKINNVSEKQSTICDENVGLPEGEEVLSMLKEAIAKTKKNVQALENLKSIRHAMKSFKLTKSREELQSKIQSTLKKIETNSYYDYNRWIENSSTKTRKYPAGRKKSCFLPQPKSESVKGASNKIPSLIQNNAFEKDSSKNLQTQNKSRKSLIRKECKDMKPKNFSTQTDHTSMIKYANNKSELNLAVPFRDLMENDSKICIKNLSGNEIIVEDFLRKFVVGFDITNSYVEPNPEKALTRTSDDKILLHKINKGTNEYYKSNYKLSTMTLPQQICCVLPSLLNRLQTGKFVITAQKNNNANNITEPTNERGKMLQSILKQPKNLDKDKHTDCTIPENLEFCKEGKLLLKTPYIHGFIEDFTSIVHKFKFKDQYKKSKLLRPSAEKKISKLLIKFPLWLNDTCNSNILQNTLFSELPDLKCNEVDRANAVIPVTSSHKIPSVTFPISLKVIKIFLQLVANGNLCKCVIVRDDSNANTFLEEEKDFVCMKEKPSKRHIVRMGTSITKLDNEVSDIASKSKDQMARKTVSLAEFINCNATKSKTFPKRCSRLKIVNVNDITGIERFMAVIGGSRSYFLSQVITTQLAKRILDNLKEFNTWTRKLNAMQALLILLLSSKSETPGLLKFRPALLHGIATARIRNSEDLEKECLAVEQDAEVVHSETQDLPLIKELHNIAKKAALEHNKPFTEQTEKVINSLINRKRRLNPSYMKIMARYAGIGLYTTSEDNC